MNRWELHDYIAKQQLNICQIAAYRDNAFVYSDTWNNYNDNVIYINPERNTVISVASMFKPTVMDRVAFIQEYVEPIVGGI